MCSWWMFLGCYQDFSPVCRSGLHHSDMTGQGSGRSGKDDQKRGKASKHGITDYAGTLQPEKDIIQGNIATVCKIMHNAGRVGGWSLTVHSLCQYQRFWSSNTASEISEQT